VLIRSERECEEIEIDLHLSLCVSVFLSFFFVCPCLSEKIRALLRGFFSKKGEIEDSQFRDVAGLR
jgi:hypothetical protein